jgi:hypothetical protein
MWRVKDKRDVSNIMGNWSYPKIIKKILEQHTGKVCSHGTTGSCHHGKCTHTAGSAVLKLRSIYRGKQHYMYQEL